MPPKSGGASQKAHPVANGVRAACGDDYNPDLNEPDPMDRTESPTPADSSPRMLDNRGPFSFGGPAFPIARTLELEQTLVTEFVTLVRSTPEKLDLPIDSPLEIQP